MMAILTEVRWYLIAVLICISLIIGYIEHLSICLFVFSMFSLEKCLYSVSAHFWLGCFLLVFAFTISCMSCLCILKINPLLVASFTNIFFPFHWLYFLFMASFTVQKLLSWLGPICLFCYYCHYSRRWIQKDVATIYVKLVFCLCFPLGILKYLVLTFRYSPFWVYFYI